MSHLVIVESPNKIKSIEKYLGSGYKVLASVGHIVYLPSSGEHRFGVDLSTWTPNYKIDPDKKEVVQKLKEEVKKSDIVLLATDPDREGEAIADNLVTFLNLNNYKRIRFNEITEVAIKSAVNNPTIINGNLVKSQVARRILDRIIGYKLSSLMKTKILNAPTNPSAGRVQSIALKLIVEREKEIEKFKSFKYLTLIAIIDEKKEIIAEYYSNDNNENKDIVNKEWILPEKAHEIQNSLTNSLKIVSTNISKKSDAKLTPFKQSALYKKADSTFGFSAASVQRSLQMLYEGFGDGGLISYPRTDSTRLSNIFVDFAQKYIANKYGEKYVAKEIKGTAGAQDAHEAIRPTSLEITPEIADEKFNLDSTTSKIYKLIWTHTIQCLINVPTREIIRYELLSGIHNFKMVSSKIIFDGYYVVTGYEAKKELPKFKDGEILNVKEFKFENHETQPPARYNDGSLIEKLDKIKVGRPSTFASTVKILSEREYATYEGRALKPTDFGKIVLEKLLEAFPRIMNEEYTAQMEDDLDKIADGNVQYENLLNNFWENFQQELSDASSSLELTQMMPLFANKKCPKCGAELLIRKNRKDGSRFFGCSSYPECKHVESDPSYKKPFNKKFINKKKIKK